jgi:hypothetical protein
MGWMIGGLNPRRGWEITYYHCVQTSSGDHWVSYPVSTRSSFPGGRAALVWNWPLTPSSAKVKHVQIYISTPQYAFMAWCSVKAQGQLYFYLLIVSVYAWLSMCCTWAQNDDDTVVTTMKKAKCRYVFRILCFPVLDFLLTIGLICAHGLWQLISSVKSVTITTSLPCLMPSGLSQTHDSIWRAFPKILVLLVSNGEFGMGLSETFREHGCLLSVS